MGKKQFSNEKKGARVKKSKSRGRELERQAHLFGSKKKRKRHDSYRIFSRINRLLERVINMAFHLI